MLAIEGASMRLTIKSCFIGALLLAGGWVPTAQSSPITWTLVDVSFTDAGTASGTFVYDADLNTYSDIRITTTSGSAFGGATYTAFRGGSRTSLVTRSSDASDATGLTTLHLLFLPPLTNIGGLAAIRPSPDPSFEGTCFSTDCSSFVLHRGILSGSVAAVPAPATLPLLLSGLAAAVCRMRRRRHVRTP
jgi:hypothetical protein